MSTMNMSPAAKPILRLPNVRFFELHMDGAKGLVAERHLGAQFSTSTWTDGNPVPTDGVVESVMASHSSGIGIGQPREAARHVALRADDRPRIPADALRALDVLDDAARRAGIIDATVTRDQARGSVEYAFRRAPWHDIETTTTPSPELLEFVHTAQGILDTLGPAMTPRT
jgi:hypothetical protein